MIPSAVLRDRITVERFLGTNSEGVDVFDTPQTGVKARLVSKGIRRTTPHGVTTVITDVAQVRPNVIVSPQSRVTHGDQRWVVAEVAVARETGRTHHLDLILDGPI